MELSLRDARELKFAVERCIARGEAAPQGADVHVRLHFDSAKDDVWFTMSHAEAIEPEPAQGDATG